jgi:hypothetical protein
VSTTVSLCQVITTTAVKKGATYSVVKLELLLPLAKSGSVHVAKRLSVRLSIRSWGMLHTSSGMCVNQLFVRSLYEMCSTNSVSGQVSRGLGDMGYRIDVQVLDDGRPKLCWKFLDEVVREDAVK